MTPTEVTTILRQFNEWRLGDEDLPQPDAKQITAAIYAAVEMIERLEAAEKERDAMRAEVQTWQEQAKAYWSKITEMERQEPYSYIYRYADPLDGSPIWRHDSRAWNGQIPGACKPLYTLPGAHPAPSVPVAALRPVIDWLRNGCDPARAADELEMLAAAPKLEGE